MRYKKSLFLCIVLSCESTLSEKYIFSLQQSKEKQFFAVHNGNFHEQFPNSWVKEWNYFWLELIFISQAKSVLAWFSMEQCITWGLWESFSTVPYMVGGVLFRTTRTRSFQFSTDCCFPRTSQRRQQWTPS